MRKLVVMLGIGMILTVSSSCKSVQPDAVNLFEGGKGYVMTAPGDIVGEVVTEEPGIWFSRGSVKKLQKRDILPSWNSEE